MTDEDGERPFKAPTLPASGQSLPESASEEPKSESTVTEPVDASSPEIPAADSVQPSPAEPLPPGVPYSVPEWAGPCRTPGYFLEVLKDGVIIAQIDLLTRATHLLGRLPTCHVPMEHPSLSRFHAVLQHRAVAGPGKGVGWYLFDLESTHGTWVNKVKVRPMEFHRLRVGHVMKFGGSSRLYVLQGPHEDQEPESDMSYSQHAAQRAKMKAMAEERRLLQEKAKLEEQSKGGCSWGMGDDDVEEEVEEVVEMADEPAHEEMYIKDPKKALRAYFEREGYDQPEYEFLDAGFGKHHCRVALLPLHATGSGRSTFAEAVISGGKKKEAVTACALEACRMLDRMGELVKAGSSRAQRRMRDWEANEFYDSDEDTFLDRTGVIEQKRARRMAQAGKSEEGTGARATGPKTDTFESLTAEFSALGQEIREVEQKLEQSKRQLQGGDQPAGSELDALDAYMAGIKAGALDRRSRMALKMRLTTMRRQSEALKKRLQAAAPNLSVLAMRAAALPSTGAKETVKKTPADSSVIEKETTKTEETVEADDKSEDQHTSSRPDKVATGRMRFSIRTTAPPRQSLPKSSLALPDDRHAAVEAEEEEEEETPSVPATQPKSASQQAKEEEEEETPSVPATQPKPASQQAKEEEEEETPCVPSTQPKLVSQQAKEEVDTSTPKLFPAKPPDHTLTPQHEETSEDATKEEKRKKRKRQRPPATAASKAVKEDDFPDDPDYVCWMPPQNQTGDGTTALNSRFGY